MKMGKAMLLALAVLLIIAALGFYGWRYFNDNYILFNGTAYSRETKVLDLSGQALGDVEELARFRHLQGLDVRRSSVTPRQYEWLSNHLPGCTILWDLPFQGGFYSRDITAITLSALTREEAVLLDYLPKLQCVDAWECRDYAALLELQQRRPDCKVFYNVEIDTNLYDCDTTQLVLRDIKCLDLVQRLTYLPKLQSVRFTGALPPMLQLRALQEAHPQVEFTWEVAVYGELLDSASHTLDLSQGGYDSAAELDHLLNYFPELQELRMGQTDIAEEALLALERGHPGLTIWWDMEVLGVRVSRDARELDISGKPVTDVAALEARLARMPNLQKVIMCGCGLSSEEMHRLDQRHEGIRFIWSVDLGGVLLRTDATWYCPNKYYLEVDDADLQDLQYCYDMVCIDIGHMRGVTHCDWAANMPKLKYLVIADTNIKDLSPLAGLEELVFLEVFMSPVRDYRPLLECPNLEDLNLGYTYGDPTPVISMNWLKRLWWPGALRVLNWNVRNQLRTNIPDAKMNFVAGSSTGEGWRASPNYYAMRDMMGMPYMTG